MDQLDEARDVALLRLAKYQQALHRYHSHRVRGQTFNIGDLVLYLIQSNKNRHKLSLPWEGPYILMGCHGSLFIVCPDPWRSIVEVSREDGLRTIDHEERCVASVPTRCRPQVLEHCGKFYDPSYAKLVQPIEDPRLEDS